MLNFVAKVAIQIGMTAANMALTMSRKIEGPRLDDLKFTSGDYGNPLPMVWGMRRVQAPVFWAEDLKEVKRESKTKGGKFNQYTYYGTWAVALAGHQIQKIRRIWFDTHLVFDLSGAGSITPFDFGETLSGQPFELSSTTSKQSPYFAIYLGTETQQPDPRMQATVEAKHGEGTCPAYRGTAYIVFKDVPLEKLGNRIPQVAVEFVAHSNNATVPTEVHSQPAIGQFSMAKFSSDFSRVLFVEYPLSGNAPFEIWDVAARAPIIWGQLPFGAPALGGSIGMYDDGSFLMVAGLGPDNKLYHVTADGASATVLKSWGVFTAQAGVRVLKDGYGTEHYVTYSGNNTFDVDGADLNYGAPCAYAFADSYGDTWGIFPASTTTTFRRLIAGGNTKGWPNTFTVSHVASGSGPSFGAHVFTDAGDQFVVGPRIEGGNAYNYIVNPATASATRVAAVAGTYDQNIWDNIVPGSASIWIGGSEVSLITGAVLRTAFTPDNIQPHTVYDPINNAVIEDVSAGLKWWFLDRIVNGGVPLSTIASDLATMVGAQTVDFSGLTQTISGWSATQGQASAILEPLLDAYDSDVRPHGFTMQGVRRAGVAAGTLTTDRFKADNPRYSITIRQAAELPRAVTINFADLNADQQPNNVRSSRPLATTAARSEKSVDLSTLALTPDAARGLADRYFRRIWNERRGVSLGLTAQQLALEPADVQTLNLDGEILTARLTRVTIKADDSLSTEWVYDNPSLATAAGGTGATFDGRDASVVVIPLLSKGFVLDIPLLTDADNSANPLLYVAAAPFAAGTWPGATVYRQLTSGEYTGEVASVPASSAVTWGYTNGALANANPNLWDRVSTVNITIQNGTLTGCTEADINASPTRNLALIGNELVNFTTATLQGDGTYTLSGFKRGRRGTEWAMSGHATRDVFLLMANAIPTSQGLSDVGTNLNFKAVTSGRTDSGAFPIPVSFTGASLKPYSPCHLAAAKDSGTGDWALSWVRRTRVGGAWTSGTPVPLGEGSEHYVVEIMNGSTVVRTVTGLTSPSFTWTASMQTTDFGSGQSTVSFRVYQVSDAVGRGFAASATF